MAQSVKVLKTRIKSVESIHKMTRAMEMVSSSKLRPLQKKLQATQEYFLKMDGIKNSLLAGFGGTKSALVEERAVKRKILLCVVTSDTGLCGNYNSAVMRKAEEFMRDKAAGSISLVAIGKKGLSHFKRSNIEIEDAYTELFGHYSAELSDKIAKSLIDKFLTGKFDEVYVAYTYFESASRHRAVVEKLLNIEKQKGAYHIEYLAEPEMESILSDFLPLYVLTKTRTIMLSSFTAEHSTRVMAMHEATDNAKDLLGDLILLSNKIRQANITSELIEVISSAGAMKE